MDFTQVDEKHGRYATVYPLVAENAALKGLAVEHGDPKMVAFAKTDGKPEWRVYEDRIPTKVNADEVFGRFVTPEAKSAFEAEAAENAATRSVMRSTDKTLSEEVSEDRKFYPAMAEGARQRFNDLKREHGSEINYSAKLGAYVHKSGPIEPFAEFQTPEAKAAWEAQGRVSERQARKEIDRAVDVVDATAERAAGNHFVADNIKGFMVPSKTKSPEAHNEQMETMRKASNEDLARVFKTTEAEFKAYERKQYAIQVEAAKLKGHSVEEFNAVKDPAQRRSMAGNSGLSNEDFARMVSVKQGFFSMIEEMKDRGIFKSKESALEAKENAVTKETPAATKTAEKASEVNIPEAKTEAIQAEAPKGRAKSKGSAQAAALAASMGR